MPLKALEDLGSSEISDHELIMMLSFQSLPTSSKGPLDLSRFLRGVTKTVLWQIKDTNPGHKVDQIPREYRSQRQGHLEVCLPFCWDTCRFSSMMRTDHGNRGPPQSPNARNVFLLPSCRNRSCLFQSCDLEKESMVNQHTAGSTHQRNGHTPAGYGQNVRKP